ncbi:MAG TPA: ABC transporter ATP-binding protein [Candidatus Eisenbacteria bacterium]|nr:ABC transporter ATP-binding protein [Candidatus Eisenbacteria bacterium]
MSDGVPARAGFEVRLENVVGRYGEKDVVGPLTVRFAGPGLYWILGPNGSGKSTLLRMMAGLKRPGAGRVRWLRGGEDLRADRLRHVSGIAAPEIQLYRDLSLRENLEFLARLRGNGARAGVRVALERAGMEGLADAQPMSLSSGQRQRARLAAAWLGDPELLLLDEPSTNLDAEARDWLYAEVRARARDTLCVVTTNQRQEPAASEPRLDLGALDPR